MAFSSRCDVSLSTISLCCSFLQHSVYRWLSMASLSTPSSIPQSQGWLRSLHVSLHSRFALLSCAYTRFNLSLRQDRSRHVWLVSFAQPRFLRLHSFLCYSATHLDVLEPVERKVDALVKLQIAKR